MSSGKADCMILLPVVLLLLSAATPATSPVSRVADADDPPARVARISYLKGSVSLQVSGDTGWSEATLNYPVTTGDRLYTDQDSRAELQVGVPVDWVPYRYGHWVWVEPWGWTWMED